MKNYQALLRKVASWMKPDALLFIHIFTHKDFAYHFEVPDLLRVHFPLLQISTRVIDLCWYQRMCCLKLVLAHWYVCLEL